MSGYNLIKPYFRARIAELGATFGKEWTDTFNADNVPANIIDKAWHLESGEANAIARNQVHLEQACTARVQAFFKGFRNPEAAFEAAEAAAKLLVEQAVSPLKATLAGNELKNVQFVGKNVAAINSTNDNLVLLTLDFNVLLVFNT